MELGNEILKVLNKTYEPLTMVETRFKRYDLVFKTDEAGRPILLFMGQKDENGKIKGERFARRLKEGSSGEILKDHWDNKGKASY
ncbi:hypothetical protein [Mucilaginibacter arboris]|uniref:Uncharacterized protein n=1 Tax=Mucilaginibacter arboris TaxID=2682090 RepID=A0A7K1T0S0_9SPHI|nr:hypothetical protein [Mucilaginibacter arboris]MVN23121.1 hypothetical protein [Mucilaginibacter arboris]